MEKEYFTLLEVAALLKRNRATVYNRMEMIGIRGHKFRGDRKTYLTKEEVTKVRDVFEKPWTAPEDLRRPQACSAVA